MTASSPDLHQGIVQSFSSSSWTASVQLLTSTFTYLASVRVARNIPSTDMIAGRRCAIAFFDPNNSQDAVLFAVWT
jgi:hypothetical protein